MTQISIIFLLCLSLFTGCASLKVNTSGSEIITPLCTNDKPKVETVVIWAALWRANQKEPLLRESMAKQGIEKFLHETNCISVASIQQISIDKELPSDEFLIEEAAKYPAKQLLFIVVRELGPTLEIGLPIIVRGYTEVVLEVKVIDLDFHSVTNFSKVHWQHGGNLVIKGIKSLPDDMASALHVLLTGK